ncbi:hypothetical protein [Actinomadura geliboluensis]|uniref:Uncharacterized protein n=1 Tax=Actinomadura geliboluensis TaxID=882440 RepID=A0A5S4GSN7_9ACTN|nr:hypothetical protein [Actinomadura geliboluensis]TMR35551.1 hypothetical protein ETD96_22685 [Actinomadura geliboluensis]
MASDGRDYFVKCLQACPPEQGASLAIELVVSQAGAMIGAPVCATSLIRIPPELAGWERRPGQPLEPGLAHASLAVERVEEVRDGLGWRERDDNPCRHAGVYALYDWCFGWDEQWLYDIDHDRTLYSHDHGLYLPPGGRGYWTRTGLQAMVDKAHQLPDPPVGLNADAVRQVADKLDHIDQANLVMVLRSVPSSWPVSDQDLEDLGWFLQQRAPAVAARMRALVED